MAWTVETKHPHTHTHDQSRIEVFPPKMRWMRRPSTHRGWIGFSPFVRFFFFFCFFLFRPLTRVRCADVLNADVFEYVRHDTHKCPQMIKPFRDGTYGRSFPACRISSTSYFHVIFVIPNALILNIKYRTWPYTQIVRARVCGIIKRKVKTFEINCVCGSRTHSTQTERTDERTKKKKNLDERKLISCGKFRHMNRYGIVFSFFFSPTHGCTRRRNQLSHRQNNNKYNNAIIDDWWCQWVNQYNAIIKP